MATIRELRQHAGLTQVEYAAAIGVSPATVYVWEARRSEPTAKQLRAIARHAGVPMESIDFDADPDKRRQRRSADGVGGSDGA